MCSDTKYGTLIMKAEDIFAYNVVIINCSRSMEKRDYEPILKFAVQLHGCQKCFSNHIYSGKQYYVVNVEKESILINAHVIVMSVQSSSTITNGLV